MVPYLTTNAAALRRPAPQRSGASGGRCGSSRAARGRVATVHRCVALLVFTACEPTAPLLDAPPAVWSSPPGPGGFPFGAVRGRLGRSQAPEPLVDLGLPGPGGGLAPLALPAAF